MINHTDTTAVELKEGVGKRVESDEMGSLLICTYCMLTYFTLIDTPVRLFVDVLRAHSLWMQ